MTSLHPTCPRGHRYIEAAQRYESRRSLYLESSKYGHTGVTDLQCRPTHHAHPPTLSLISGPQKKGHSIIANKRTLNYARRFSKRPPKIGTTHASHACSESETHTRDKRVQVDRDGCVGLTPWCCATLTCCCAGGACMESSGYYRR